jgi:hypothetical protein
MPDEYTMLLLLKAAAAAFVCAHLQTTNIKMRKQNITVVMTGKGKYIIININNICLLLLIPVYSAILKKMIIYFFKMSMTK